MGRHRIANKQLVDAQLSCGNRETKPSVCYWQRGQSTMEFCLVTGVFFILVVMGITLWNMLAQGSIEDHALLSAAHNIAAEAVNVLADILIV